MASFFPPFICEDLQEEHGCARAADPASPVVQDREHFPSQIRVHAQNFPYSVFRCSEHRSLRILMPVVVDINSLSIYRDRQIQGER